MARPTVLDEVKKSEICALVTAGMPMTRIARYVGHDRKTIYRERQRDAAFDQRVRRAELTTDLAPLQAMRRAAETHWRAAAWIIDRDDRLRAERRATVRQPLFTRDDLQQMADDVKRLVERAVLSPFESERLLYQIDSLYLRATPSGGKSRRPARAAETGPSFEERLQFCDAYGEEISPEEEQAMVASILAKVRSEALDAEHIDAESPAEGFAPIAPVGRTKPRSPEGPQSPEGR